MTHDIYLYIRERWWVPDSQLAKEFPGREHDVLHLINLGLVQIVTVNDVRYFRSYIPARERAA